MAHNLNFNTGNNEYAFFSVKEKAWHGLGKVLNDYPTAQEAIIHAGLNFEVVKRPLFTYDSFNAEVEPAPDEQDFRRPDVQIKDFFATVRRDTDEVLGVVGSKYEVVQNDVAFTFFDNLVNDGSGIFYETAGALGKGEKIFITAKLPDVMRIGRKDAIEEYVFLTTSHDGSGSITAAFTPVRIVCNNTLNAALRNMKNAVNIKHTANAADNLKHAAKIIHLSKSMHETLEPLFNRWAKTRVNDAEVKKLVALAMSPNNEVFTAIAESKEIEFSRQFETTINDVYEYAMKAESQQLETTKGTLFGVYNAVTGYYQNMKNYKTPDSKLQSILYGTVADKTEKAFELCMNASEFLN